MSVDGLEWFCDRRVVTFKVVAFKVVAVKAG